jgi:hypothetical protein
MDATNPISKIAVPIAKMVPPMIKIDALAQTGVLWWYMSTMTDLEDREIYTILGLNAVVHGLLHDTACRLQGDGATAAALQ